MTNKIVVFDLDDVLIHEGFDLPILVDEGERILQDLSSRQYKIVIASHNYDSEKILKRLGIFHYFSLILAYHDLTDKVSHFKKVLSHFGCEKGDITFYDDLQDNIRAVRKFGIRSVLINWKTGITYEDVIELK